MELTISFVLEREARQTVRYSEISTDFIGTLYVHKSTFNGDVYPLYLDVTLSTTAKGRMREDGCEG
jgi:hypothetical protein